MPNLNKVMLMGNLTRDPEIRYTPKGTAVTDVGLAINRYFSGDDGERREETVFVDVTLWGRQAEIVGQYTRKGRPLYVEGRLQLDTWEDKQTGKNRSRLKVVGENIQLLGSREDGGGSGQGSYGGNASGGGYSSPPPQAQGPSAGGGGGGYQSAPPPQQQSAPADTFSNTPPAAAPQEEEDDIPF